MIFEYDTVELIIESGRPETRDTAIDLLNSVGKAGWEVISVVTLVPQSKFRAFLKRSLDNPPSM